MTCDRCGPAVTATYEVRKSDGRLTFCGHCHNIYWHSLWDAGWSVTIMPIPVRVGAR